MFDKYSFMVFSFYMAAPEEIELAGKLKRKAQEARLVPISDFEYLQYAITMKDKSKKSIVNKMKEMQKFRNHYIVPDILVDHELAVSDINGSYYDSSGLVTSVGRDDVGGHGVHSTQGRHFFPRRFCPDKWRTYLVGLYYRFHALNSDISSIRNGVLFISDCGRMKSENTIDTPPAHYDFTHVYPLIIKKGIILDASPSVRTYGLTYTSECSRVYN